MDSALTEKDKEEEEEKEVDGNGIDGVVKGGKTLNSSVFSVCSF